MAEAERYLPSLLDKLEPIIEKNGLLDTEINIRITGCPNGCARPALGEISFIGNLQANTICIWVLALQVSCLNKMYKENIGEAEILETLEPIIAHYAKERKKGEHFGDFVIRAGYIKATTDGTNFHSA